MTCCFHCELPVATPQRYSTALLGETRAFCCPGCQAIAQTLVSSGLERFYLHRSKASTNPQALPAQPLDELALFDKPAAQKPFVRPSGTSVEATLYIEGISCAACGWLIDRHIAGLAGVEEARLNLSTHRLYLRWNPARQSLSRLLGELRRIGYAGQPWQADQATQAQERENRQDLRRLGVAGLLWMQAMMATMATWPEFNADLSLELHGILRWVAMFLTTPILFYSCAPFFRGAARAVRGRRLNMDVPVALALSGAYGAGVYTAISGQGDLYFDAVGMFALFLLGGRYLERRARQRTAAAATRLSQLLPASCLRLAPDGSTHRVLLDELAVGDRVRLPPGAVVPADGCIVEGHSTLDEALLTGEFRPQPKTRGDRVAAGTLNVEHALTLEVLAVGASTRLSAIMRLLERAQSQKPVWAQMADRAAHVFIWVSLLLALAFGIFWWKFDPSQAFWVVLAMLVATCPCALSLATPVALTTATGTLYRLGLLLTRGHVLEQLTQVDTLVLDKTGTLTLGRPQLKRVLPLGDADADLCLMLARALEADSEHPLAKAFGRSSLIAEAVVRHAGSGLEGWVQGQRLRIGRAEFACALSGCDTPPAPDGTSQWLLLAGDEGPMAWFELDDALRPDAPALVDAAKARGWHILMLSGDSSPAVTHVAGQLGIAFEGGLSPAGKLAVLNRLHEQGRRVLMLGDGVNDVPSLARADVSIAMGSATDLAKTSADAVLLTDRLGTLVEALSVARRTRNIIVQNLLWAACYNGLVLPFAALGQVTPLWAAAGMSISSLTVVLNALRLSRISPAARRPRIVQEQAPCQRSTS